MTLPFDGIKYRDAAYTLPTYYHPKAAFQAQALSNCLRNSYFAAGQNSRMVLQQVYGTNFEDLDANDERVTVRSLSDLAIAKGRVFIPEKITHCRANVSFSALALGMSYVNISVKVEPDAPGAGLSSADSQAQTEITANVSGGMMNTAQTVGDITPARTAEPSADLSKIELGQLCTVTVFASGGQKAKSAETSGFTTSGSSMFINYSGSAFSAGEYVIFDTPSYEYVSSPPPFDNWRTHEIQAATSSQIEIVEGPTESFPGDEDEAGTITLVAYPIPIRPHFVSVFLGVD